MPHFFSGAWKSPPKCFPTRHGLPLSLFYLSFIVVLSISNLNYVSLPKKGDLNLSISLLSARGRPATSSFCLLSSWLYQIWIWGVYKSSFSSFESQIGWYGITFTCEARWPFVKDKNPIIQDDCLLFVLTVSLTLASFHFFFLIKRESIDYQH